MRLRLHKSDTKRGNTLVIAGFLSLVSVRLAVNRFEAPGEERRDLVCLCCGGIYRPDTVGIMGALTCTSCQRSASDYEDALPGLIWPVDLQDRADAIQAQGRADFIDRNGGIPKVIRDHEQMIAAKLAEYDASKGGGETVAKGVVEGDTQGTPGGGAGGEPPKGV